MTSGHEHRHVPMRRGSRLHLLLSQPLLWSSDMKRVEASKYPWGPARMDMFMVNPNAHQMFYLSALSVLHRWTGLTLDLQDPPSEDSNERPAQRSID